MLSDACRSMIAVPDIRSGCFSGAEMNDFLFVCPLVRLSMLFSLRFASRNVSESVAPPLAPPSSPAVVAVVPRRKTSVICVPGIGQSV